MKLNIQENINVIEDNLRSHVEWITPNHLIKNVYIYATLPAGKLFRPQLSLAAAIDFATSKYLKTENLFNKKSNHAMLASALEMHHAYTLIHDDLPCMDNDDIRRGKPSTHKQFNEWKALLAGDGLLNGSYQLISKINSPYTQTILQLFSWALGPKGLIHGQVLDLSGEMKENFDQLIKTHELKTGRLIQLSLVAGHLLIPDTSCSSSDRYRSSITLAKLGFHTGILFQLLDDLSELADPLNEHEKSINPWLNFGMESYQTLLNSLNKSHQLLINHKLTSIHSTMKLYYTKMLTQIEPNISSIQAVLKVANKNINLSPVIDTLHRLND